MAKEDIFSKISLKDYNNILESILEQKAFSEDVKNLLLSMLYKIENAYQDYKTVKINAESKNYFLTKIIQIIQKKCKEITLIKPRSEESKELEKNNVNYIVEKEKGNIKVYPNERIMLEALVTLEQKEIHLEKEYDFFKLGIQSVLEQGNRMNCVEVIRDFNGWSWDITTSQMESKNCNLVYQNLGMLVGNTFLQTWIIGEEEQDDEEVEIPNNEILRSKYNESFGMTKEEMKQEKQIDYIKTMHEILIEQYGEEKATKFLTQLIKTMIAMGSNRNKKQKEIVLKRQIQLEKELKKMEDNRTYLDLLSNEKKEISIQIKEIDTILSDAKILKEEYEKRNQKLPNKNKIFSVSHLRIMLEKERKKKLEQIQECNKQMKPKEFVRKKREIEEKLKFYQEIGMEKEKRVEEEKQIKKLQIYFLDCMQHKIQNVQTKKQIADLIYEMRYYGHIPYEQGTITDLEEIKSMLEKIEGQLIQKACQEKILTSFSKKEKLNTDILKNQFQSKIINLENTIYILKYHKGILKIEIYDTNIEEERKEIPIMEKVELTVKLNKKIKVWTNWGQVQIETLGQFGPSLKK